MFLFHIFTVLQDSPHHVFTVKVASQDPEDQYQENVDGTPEKGMLIVIKKFIILYDVTE